jgi:hypothetical protein
MPEKPFVQEYEMPDGTVITSVVMDREDFESLLDELAQVKISGLTPEEAEQVKKIGYVPLLSRGAKTEFVFERYGVSGKLISMIIRGQGQRIAAEHELSDIVHDMVRKQIEMN